MGTPVSVPLSARTVCRGMRSFRVCETTGGTKWYIVEYESDAFPPFEAVERCLSALKAMGK